MPRKSQRIDAAHPIKITPHQREAMISCTQLNAAIIPNKLPKELVEVLAENKHVRIERIVSTGQASPDGSWYDQEDAEWVVVLKGEAKMLFVGDVQPIQMRPGDFINIPAHRKHRGEWTTPDEPTVCLAVFYP